MNVQRQSPEYALATHSMFTCRTRAHLAKKAKTRKVFVGEALEILSCR